MKVISLNVGLPREVQWHGRTVLTSIWKEPVTGPVRLTRLNLDGDLQSDLSVHGGNDKAVYAYPSEHYAAWRRELPDMQLPPGIFGENLTTEGLLENDVCIGDRFQIGSAALIVTQPRMPCFKLGIRFGDGRMVKAFAKASRPGAYLRIIEAGELGVGDDVTILSRPEHGVTLAMCSDAVLKDRSLAAQVLAAPQLSSKLRRDLAEAA